LQHIGGLRTALFNYLFARSQGGKFILRLEDTDRHRYDESYVKNLYDTFSWLGLKWDEGPDVGGPSAPYIQSERVELYQNYARELVERGMGYYCFCTQERLARLREERQVSHESASGYDGLCRSVPADEALRRAADGEHCVIRLKLPLDESTECHDLLLGDVVWKNENINSDPVLLKSDGYPTYHLANIVDDHLMGITHVLRAQEWLSSTPVHIILYRAFGWEPPQFCHLPMVMGDDGKKLSKRHGATSIDEFRKLGYLPEALLNYVALLGASFEEGRDVYTVDELASRFKLERLNKAPAVFDYAKLQWYNGHYIRMKSDEELAALALPFAIDMDLFGKGGQQIWIRLGTAPGQPRPNNRQYPGQKPKPAQLEIFKAAIPLVKERAILLSQIPGKFVYLFSPPPVPNADEFIPKKGDVETAVKFLRITREMIPYFSTAAEEEAVVHCKAGAVAADVKMGDLLTPLRVAITGTRVSPPLFGSIRILGTEECLHRIDRALEKLTHVVTRRP
jgi:glutamyl-tRNA synthetase